MIDVYENTAVLRGGPMAGKYIALQADQTILYIAAFDEGSGKIMKGHYHCPKGSRTAFWRGWTTEYKDG